MQKMRDHEVKYKAFMAKIIELSGLEMVQEIIA